MQYYQIPCPSCGKPVPFDSDMLRWGEITCPNFDCMQPVKIPKEPDASMEVDGPPAPADPALSAAPEDAAPLPMTTEPPAAPTPAPEPEPAAAPAPAQEAAPEPTPEPETAPAPAPAPPPAPSPATETEFARANDTEFQKAKAAESPAKPDTAAAGDAPKAAGSKKKLPEPKILILAVLGIAILGVVGKMFWPKSAAPAEAEQVAQADPEAEAKAAEEKAKAEAEAKAAEEQAKAEAEAEAEAKARAEAAAEARRMAEARAAAEAKAKAAAEAAKAKAEAEAKAKAEAEARAKAREKIAKLLSVKAITGSVVMISTGAKNYPMEQGDEWDLTTPDGKIPVKILSIENRTVKLQVGDDPEPFILYAP